MVKGRTQSREGASVSSHDTKNPTGGVSMGHVIEPPNPVDAYSFSKSFGVHLLPDYGPVCSVKRPVRTRMRGVVGAGGEIPPATRLTLQFNIIVCTPLNKGIFCLIVFKLVPFIEVAFFFKQVFKSCICSTPAEYRLNPI